MELESLLLLVEEVVGMVEEEMLPHPLPERGGTKMSLSMRIPQILAAERPVKEEKKSRYSDLYISNNKLTIKCIHH